MSAMDDVSMIYQEEFLLFAAILFHNLWFFKNDIYHNNSQWSFLERKKKINCNFKGHWNTMIRNREGRTDGARSLLTRWTLPRPGRIRVNVDFVNKEGTRAVGVVVRNDRGSILALFAIKISFLSIVHGELMATFWGLKVLQQMGSYYFHSFTPFQLSSFSFFFGDSSVQLIMKVEFTPDCSLNDSDDEGAELSISMLISGLRSAFMTTDFDWVEETLIYREAKLKNRIEELESENIQLYHEVKRLRIYNSETRVVKENYDTMRNRLKVAEEKILDCNLRAKAAEEKVLDCNLRAKAAEEKILDANLRTKAAELKVVDAELRVKEADEKVRDSTERTRVAEDRAKKLDEGAEAKTPKVERLEQLLDDVKKTERKIIEEIVHMKQNGDWSKFDELEKKVSVLEAEKEIVFKLESLVPMLTTTGSSESHKANEEKGTDTNDGFAVVSGSAHLPSPPICSTNQDSAKPLITYSRRNKKGNQNKNQKQG
uniref:Uncharacterized protein n=1 Tax=Cannabis sativa TaxID=3483 RepID=A0A803Q0U4_CANSA